MGSLAKELDAFTAALIERTCLPNACVLRDMAAATQAREANYHPLGVGDTAPDFAVPDQFGATVRLSERLARGPVVLTFTLGGWSPFCDIALRAYDRILPSLRRSGADLFAISPQTPAQNRDTAEAHWLGFRILSDQGGAVAGAFGLMRPVADDKRAMLLRLGHDVPKLNGTATWELPVTATYVIARDHTIARADLDPRVMVRMEPGEVLAAVRALAEHAAA